MEKREGNRGSAPFLVIVHCVPLMHSYVAERFLPLNVRREGTKGYYFLPKS